MGVGLGLGAGAFGWVGVAGAQDATPAPAFDPAACYQPFGDAETVQYDAVGDGGFNIGLSNSYIGNVWRTQMIKMAQAYAELPENQPYISEFQVSTVDRNDAEQIAAIENMISNGAQALVIIANTPSALVPVVQQARADGIVVVSFDSVVQADPPDPSLDLGITVNEDQVEMGRLWAQFLVDEIGDSGKILMVNGVAGTGVDTERRQGAAEVFGQYPNIEIVEVVGNWDPGQAQTATASALAANPDIAGVWCQGGTDGVVRAFLDAGKPLVPVAGRGRERLPQADARVRRGDAGPLDRAVAGARRRVDAGRDQPAARRARTERGLGAAAVGDDRPSWSQGVNVFPDAPDNFFTPVQIPECGVTLTFEEIDRQEV
jgi:ribose transport system substrate-binding protein